MIEHERLRIYRLAGRNTTLLWCRDTKNDWRAELERGEQPETLSGVSIEGPSGRGRVRAYDPWTGNWSEAVRKGGRVRLPNFRRSLVLRIG
jgi:hypothetical protein